MAEYLFAFLAVCIAVLWLYIFVEFAVVSILNSSHHDRYVVAFPFSLWFPSGFMYTMQTSFHMFGFFQLCLCLDIYPDIFFNFYNWLFVFKFYIRHVFCKYILSQSVACHLAVGTELKNAESHQTNFLLCSLVVVRERPLVCPGNLASL